MAVKSRGRPAAPRYHLRDRRRAASALPDADRPVARRVATERDAVPRGAARRDHGSRECDRNRNRPSTGQSTGQNRAGRGFAVGRGGPGAARADCAASGDDQAAARLHDRARRARSQCPRDDLGQRRYALRGQRTRRQRLRADTAAAGHARRGRRPRHRVGAARAGGRGVSWRRALRLGGVAHIALRRHRAPPRRPAEPGGRQRPLSDRRPSRPQVHRLRSRRQALRARGRALQCLRERPRPLRRDHAHESRRHRAPRSTRAGCATPWASTGIRARTSYGSPTTGATCSATIFRRTR